LNELELRETLQSLRNNLEIILDTDLGKYEITNPTGQKIKEVPAIWVEPPELPANYRMKINSGIEAIIQREPDPRYDPLLGNYIEIAHYTIVLKQYNLSRSLTPVVGRIQVSDYWNVLESPRVTPYTKTAEGIIRPKATIKVSSAKLLS
jgi:hypothetical protein